MVFLIILTVLILLFLIFMSINIKIEIENLRISLPKINKKITNKESKILLKIYLLKKIKIAEINLKNIKTDDKKFKERMNKFKNNIKIGFNKNVIKYILNVKYKIEKLDLNICIGIEDAAATAISIGIVSSLIGIIIRDKITDLTKNRFEVIPIYKNKNMLKIQLDGIFTFNIVNIKNIVKFLRKGRVDKDDRTSYRRSYAYSDE